MARDGCCHTTLHCTPSNTTSVHAILAAPSGSFSSQSCTPWQILTLDRWWMMTALGVFANLVKDNIMQKFNMHAPIVSTLAEFKLTPIWMLCAWHHCIPVYPYVRMTSSHNLMYGWHHHITLCMDDIIISPYVWRTSSHNTMYGWHHQSHNSRCKIHHQN